MTTGRFHTMRISILSAMFLAALPGIALAQTSQPEPPVLPPPLYAMPAQAPPPPTAQPTAPPGPAIVPGMNALYNVLTYGQHGTQCTPSPLVPTACR